MNEYMHQPFLREIFASIALCLEECGEPLTEAQKTILDAAVASSGVPA